MKKSAGILFIYNNKALLCHPSKAKWINTFGPPKGGIEKGETPLQAAIRECKEEASLQIEPSMVDTKNCVTIDYSTKNGKIFKKVILFVVKLKSLDEIGLQEEVIIQDKLQLEEVDWCGFMSKDEWVDKVFWRFKEVLDANIS